MLALLALGSNIGDRAKALQRARDRLRARGLDILAASAVFESEAMGWPGGTPFLNAVLQVKVDLDPWQLLSLVKELERTLGRAAGRERNAPRVIDIDILACLGVRIVSPELSLPHPRIEGRDFVRAPLDTLADAARFFPAGLPVGTGLVPRRVAGADWSMEDDSVRQ